MLFGAIGAVLLFALAPDRAAAQALGSVQVGQAPSLAETHWAGRLGWGDQAASSASDWTLYFRSDGVLVSTFGGVSHDDGAWRQHNALVTIEIGDSVSVGAIHGDLIEGVAYRQDGERGTWIFHLEAAQAFACPHNMTALRGTTASLQCICPPNMSFTTVWGERSSYTDDSDVCTAAVHAGIVTAAEGGAIAVTPRPGRASYRGSSSNGVTTLPYGSWSGSFTIADATPR